VRRLRRPGLPLSPAMRSAAEVSDDDPRGARGEVAERRCPLPGAGVQDNLMAFTHKGPGSSAAEPVGGAGDEDTGHEAILPPIDKVRALTRGGLALGRPPTSG